MGEKSNLYKLRPSGGSKDCFFLFEYDAHVDSISFLESEYAATWHAELEFYLGARHSYPGFLSAITLANLKKRHGDK
jgi:hypothetical protein